MSKALASFAVLVLAAASLVAQAAAVSPAPIAPAGGKSAKLETLLQQMNSTRGDAKLDAAIAVINELVAERNAMLASGSMACCAKESTADHDCAAMMKSGSGDMKAKDCCAGMSKGKAKDAQSGCCDKSRKADGAKMDCCH